MIVSEGMRERVGLPPSKMSQKHKYHPSKVSPPMPYKDYNIKSKSVKSSTCDGCGWEIVTIRCMNPNC